MHIQPTVWGLTDDTDLDHPSFLHGADNGHTEREAHGRYDKGSLGSDPPEHVRPDQTRQISVPILVLL